MSGKIRSGHIVLLVINIALVLAFGTSFLLKRNYEFMIYVGAIIV
jgi:hypothetical protein